MSDDMIALSGVVDEQVAYDDESVISRAATDCPSIRVNRPL
jgi:ferredoxin